MKKLSILGIVFASLFTSLSTGCSLKFNSPCKDGCKLEANYICDMTCEDCGITYKKLESNNSLLKRVNNIDFSNDSTELFSMIDKMYQYLTDTYSADSSKKTIIIAKMQELFTELNTKYMNFMMNQDYYLRAMCEISIYGSSSWYNSFTNAMDNINSGFENLMSDIFYSPVGEAVLGLSPDDQEINEWLSSYKTNRYNEIKEDDSESETSTTPSRIDTLYDEITDFDTSEGEESDLYRLAEEYFSLLSATTPAKYNNYYEYQLAIENNDQISIEKAKEYFDYFKNYGGNYYNKLSSSLENEKDSEVYNLVKMYSVAGKNYKGVNFMQTVVNYLKTLKNDQMNAFDVINDAYKNGLVFYGTHPFTSGSKTVTIINNDEKIKFIVYVNENNLNAITQVHEMGHYLDNHRNGAVFNEFTSTTQEYLFDAYYFNNYNTRSKKEKKVMQNAIVFSELRTALYYALYEDIANCIFSNYSDIDNSFKDGISLEEYPSFFSQMFAKYGLDDSDLYDYKSAIQHIMWGCGYDISYVVNRLYGINTFFDAVENYEQVVGNYMNYLCCDGSETTLNDILKCNFLSPLDSFVFASTNSNLDKLF